MIDQFFIHIDYFDLVFIIAILPAHMPRRTKSKLPISLFIKKLEKLWDKNKFVCIGLDPVQEKLPVSITKKYKSIDEQYFQFNKAIIDATADLVCAYKPQVAHYEERGVEGWKALDKTAKYLHKNCPKIPVIIDAKRADIGSTNTYYAKAFFDQMGFDAITVNPYFGKEALKSFLDYKDKGIIILVRTSNPGAGEFQDIKNKKGEPLYLTIAKNVANNWNENGNCCIVVGATYPDELSQIRKVVGNMPILIPGIGVQGGDVDSTVKAGMDSRGWGMIIHSSRAIIFASSGPDFAEAARRKTIELDKQISNARQSLVREEEVKKILAGTDAVLTNGHFVYVSGKHGDKYINKDAIYPNIEAIRKLCKMWAEDFKDSGVEVVVGPAMGGILLSHDTAGELSKILNTEIPGVYAEKNGDGGFIFTRGYDKFVKGKKVLVVEDVLTTGGSVKKVIDLTRGAGGKIIGLGVIANRGGVKATDIGIDRINALINIQMITMEPNDCTLCKNGVPVNTNVGKGKLFLAGKKIA